MEVQNEKSFTKVWMSCGHVLQKSLRDTEIFVWVIFFLEMLVALKIQKTPNHTNI